jgi:hypothetical protein
MTASAAKGPDQHAVMAAAIDNFGAPQAKETPSSPEEEVQLNTHASRAFVHRPVKKGSPMLQCYVERDRNGMNRLHPVYRLYIEDGENFLLSAKKRMKNKTSNYLLSMELEPNDRRSNMIAGKIRANWTGSTYTLYDAGLNPEKAVTESSVRKCLGVVSRMRSLHSQHRSSAFYDIAASSGGLRI